MWTHTHKYAQRWKSAAGSRMPALSVISLRTPAFQGRRNNETAQSPLLCPHEVSQQRASSPRQHLTSSQPHITVWSKSSAVALFSFDWQARTESSFLRKAFTANASRYLTGVIIHAGPVIWSLFLLFFPFFGGIVFLFGSVLLPHSKSACRLKVAHLALAVQSDCRFQVRLPMTEL